MATYDNEKFAAGAIEQVETGKSTTSEELNNERIDRFTPAEQKKIISRVDRRLVLLLGFMYCVSLMDRTNMVSTCLAHGFVCLADFSRVSQQSLA